jgi:pimeloyl-ACP methyl ester carboxylesterase
MRVFGLWLASFSALANATASANLSHTNLLQYRATNETVAAVTSTNDWLLRKRSILAAMQQVMGPLPKSNSTAPAVRVIEEIDCGDYVRRKITYESEPGSDVPAYLLIPKRALNGRAPAPGILTLHQTHPAGYNVVVGLGQSPNDEYGVELVQRGYVCLAPAYPLLANYQPDLRSLGYVSGTMKAIHDNRRGLDLLESLPFVKKGSFGVIGHSLGGHNGLYTAAFDERLRVVASSCGFDSFRDYKDGNIAGWTSERYMPRLKNFAPDRYPFDFHEVIAAIAPRTVFVNAPVDDTNFRWRSVQSIVTATRPVFALHGVAENLIVEFPPCGHEFPRAMRDSAYRLFDLHLKQD